MSEEKNEERVPTDAELKEAKIKEFNENPDKFINVDDIIGGAVRHKGQIRIPMCASTKDELYISQSKLSHAINRQLHYIDTLQAKDMVNKSRIVKPGGNRMTNFLRGGGGKIG